MKKVKTLTALICTSALLVGCSSAGVETNAPDVTPLAVYDVAQPETLAATNSLNQTSAATVTNAQTEGLFTMEGNTFVNNALGYRVDALGLSVIDMGDATYRATLADAAGSTRLEIFTQTLNVSAEEYLTYSNRFLENTADFTKLYENTTTESGRTVHILAYDRTPLARVANDRSHYGIVDIIDADGQSACLLLSSAFPVDATTLEALARSFETFTPTVEAKDYPRFQRTRTDLNEETAAYLQETFGEDADFTWGVFEPNVGSTKITDLINLQDELEHNFKLALCYSDLYKEYKTDLIYDTLSLLYENGTTVELTLQPVGYDPATNPNIVYDILNGEYDAFLHAYAADVARFGHPVLFRPFNEMNGDWCTYSGYWAGRDTSTYVELYRYIYQIFEEEGANKNTLWIWNPNERSLPEFAWNAADNYYPGDEYVDLVGLTGYNTGTYYAVETWRSFDEIYAPVYAQMEPQYQQPFLITEFSCSDYGGSKADWVEDMFAKLPNYPRIKAAIWWDSADRDENNNISRSYFIDNNSAAFRIFKEQLAEEDYEAKPRDRSAILQKYLINES